MFPIPSCFGIITVPGYSVPASRIIMKDSMVNERFLRNDIDALNENLLLLSVKTFVIDALDS